MIGLGTTVPLILIDSAFYEKKVFPTWNLIVYNVLSGSDKGPDLYGVEPWWFYIANGFLNFNIAIIFSIASIPLLVKVYCFLFNRDT